MLVNVQTMDDVYNERRKPRPRGLRHGARRFERLVWWESS